MAKKIDDDMRAYMVFWRKEDIGLQIQYVQALDTQNAVDIAREFCLPKGAEVFDVGEVKTDWK